VNLSEFLWDGDGLHQGEISRSKFRSATARAAVTLKPYDLDLLEHKFAVRRCVLTTKSNGMSYRTIGGCTWGTEIIVCKFRSATARAGTLLKPTYLSTGSPCPGGLVAPG
jgi:hypothetical protein